MTMNRPLEFERKLCLATYFKKTENNHYHFYFHIGPENSEFMTNYEEHTSPSMNMTLLGKTEIPAKFQNVFNKYPSFVPEKGQRRAGFIEYILRGSTAITDRVYPKDKISDERLAKELKWFGTFLERISTTHLLENHKEVTHISTSEEQQEARKEQLKQIGLPLCQDVPIDEWLDAFTRHLQKHEII